jgi:tetratricopeptide (TPR) repeat protein
MAIDPYSSCPCGSGKKVKFCCAALTDEMELIQKMLEGQQRVACLDHVESLDRKHPDQPFLLGVRSMLEIQLERFEDAEKTVRRFRETCPDNPIAWTETTLLRLTQGEIVEAVAALQQALRLSGTQLPMRAYEALGMLGGALVSVGSIFSGRAHLLLQAIIGRDQDRRAAEMLMRLNSAQEIPLLLRDQWYLQSAEDNAPWKEDYEAARALGERGRWAEAVEQFEAIREKAPRAPAVVRSLGILYGRLARDADAIKMLRKFATLDGCSLDDQVEAEALCQLIDSEVEPDVYDVVTVVYPTNDEEALWGKLTSDPRISPVDVDLAQLSDEGEPPPRAAFVLTDRAMPDTGVDIASDAIPVAQGELFVFGKQTDCDARLEFIVTRNSGFDAAKATLSEVCGPVLGESIGEEVSEQVSIVQDEMSWHWRLPPDTPRDHYMQLMEGTQSHALLEKWPVLKMNLFGGSSAQEFAADPANNVKLLGAILLLEIGQMRGGAFDFNQLRSKLGLPTAEVIDPQEINVSHVSAMRLGRLDFAKLDDDQIYAAYRRSESLGLASALDPLARQVIDRPSMKDKISPADAYGHLAQAAGATDEAIRHVESARKASTEEGRSCADWDLFELTIRIARRESDHVQRLIQHIEHDHMQEPDVGRALVGLLVNAGLINPDGSPTMGPGGPTPEPVAASGGAESGGLWTPDSPAPSGDGGEKKVIWTPD